MKPTRQPPRNFRPEPFAYHQVLELEIETLTNMGQGLARVDGWVVMVRFALPGELVTARVYRNDKNYSEADLLEVLRPSPDRVEPPCPLFGECGGCQYQNLSYEAQLRWKTQQVQELLKQMARVDAAVLPAIPSPLEYGYRSKLTPHFPKPDAGEAPLIGFLKPGSKFDYVEIERCPIASDAMNETLEELRKEVVQKAAQGAYKRGATLLIREHLDGITTDPKSIIREKVGDIVFTFPACEFFQNNPHILERFANYGGEMAAKHGARYLVDAYCGSGLFCLTAAKRFEQAVGVEVSEYSIQYAVKNLADNQIGNARFVVGDAAAIFENLTFPGDESAVIIDPPRRGSDENFLNQLVAFGPRTIVYVSCNPATQMRDLRTLLDSGYAIDEVQPFDLFPQTRHLECVITLSRPATA